MVEKSDAGDCIQKRLERTFEEIDEGFLGRKALTPGKDGVLHNVGNAGAIGRRRAECDAKDFVIIFAGKKEERCAGLFVSEHVGDDFTLLLSKGIDGLRPFECPVF